jgi:hypothetical protein
LIASTRIGDRYHIQRAYKNLILVTEVLDDTCIQPVDFSFETISNIVLMPWPLHWLRQQQQLPAPHCLGRSRKLRDYSSSKRSIGRAEMNIRLLAAISMVMGLLPYTAPSFAQPTLRNLTGTVQDRHHEPLNGAIVEIENENTKSVISYITDRSGRYSFKRIQGEVDYRVWFTYRGRRSGVRELSQFDDHQNATINLTVKSY